MAAQIDDASRALLDAPNFAHISTFRKDGTVHGAVVWVHTDGDKVTLNSAEGRAWPANVRRDPRITVTVANSENPYEYVEVRGRVTEDTQEGADDDINALAKKYLGQDEYPFRQPGEVRVIFRIEPDSVRHVKAG